MEIRWTKRGRRDRGAADARKGPVYLLQTRPGLHGRSYAPDFGVYIRVQGSGGVIEYRSLSRQLVLFCVERRKAWRMLQSKARIENREYKAQRSLLADVDAGRISMEELFARAEELMRERMKGGTSSPAAASHGSRPAATAPGAAAEAPPRGPVGPPAIGGNFVTT